MSSRKTQILMIGSYPIANPVHGGQRRAFAIYNFYIKSGFEVKYIGIYRAAHYRDNKDRGKDDLAVADGIFYKAKQQLRNLKKGIDEYDDIISATAVSTNKELSNELSSQISKADIVQIEQPYCYIAFPKKVTVSKLIYSSHNVESKLRASESLEGDTELVAKYVGSLEEGIVRKANGIIVCTKEDGKYYQDKYNFDNRNNLALLPNATSLKKTNNRARRKINNLLTKRGVENYILFISSAHKPNFDAFMNLIGYGLGFLSPGNFIVMAGEVSLLLNQELENNKDPLVTCILQKILLVSKANDAELQAFIEKAKGIILPIIGGGGSNLKTAEALISGKSIIATSNAFRGYDGYIQNKNVYIANTKKEFIDKIKQLFNKNLPDDEGSKLQITKELIWEGRFAEYGDKINSIILRQIS